MPTIVPESKPGDKNPRRTRLVENAAICNDCEWHATGELSVWTGLDHWMTTGHELLTEIRERNVTRYPRRVTG